MNHMASDLQGPQASHLFPHCSPAVLLEALSVGGLPNRAGSHGTLWVVISSALTVGLSGRTVTVPENSSSVFTLYILNLAGHLLEIFFFFLPVLGFEIRASRLLGRCSTN
jgi:hypothetical protein